MSIRIHAPQGRGPADVFVRCPRHLEDLLAGELAALGIEDVQLRTGGVAVRVELAMAVRICLHSRIATRVLWPFASFEAPDADALYAGAAQVDWDRYVRGLPRLAVGFDGTSRTLRHTRFSAQRVKDAVVDGLRTARAARPDVDARDPEFQLQAVLHRGRVTLHLDLAGTALHRRGWRRDGGEAPLKENLAAALLLRGGWRVGTTDWLVDPMCGSGTLLVEGALLAAGLPPGLGRPHFGFEAWTGAPEGLRAELEAEWDGPVCAPRLFGRDLDPEQLARARAHLEAAGAGERFEAEIDLAVSQVARLPALPGPIGLVASNPPYGVRLEDSGQIGQLGVTLRRLAPDAPVALLVAPGREAGPRSLETLLLRLDLPRLERHPCRNGALEAAMLVGRVEARGEGSTDAPDGPALEHAAMFANRIRKNRKRLARFAQRVGTDALRLYDRDLPEYGLVVDRYGDDLVVQEFRPPATVDPVLAARRRDAALARLPEATGVPPERIHFRERRRQRPDSQYDVQAREADRREVREGAARLLVNLSDYLDTGLYLDSRGVRRRLHDDFARLAGGRFLNLYAYTCTATVQAALGGAQESLSVDLSPTYLRWGAEQCRRNGLDGARHRQVQADVLPWLRGDGRASGRFDRVLLDPPTFSNSARTEQDLDLQRDQGALLDAATERLAPGGELLFVVHARRFRLDWAPPAGFELEEITRHTLDEDCARGRPAHRCWVVRRATTT
ncbi:MAG: bifunctional 23S rRNA (guanine(2069)-N(7))-methyltransferase RlmK/23S rRNA (guanine(2445)-N(2))-methyltransferase RlmL [Pseudomonadales bacterium]|jgi:23S rRNA (guanine2445-N2)-methyltransferase / 23S rRNA (guanine2069-N7)-methyltransferase|nr:bifunctional 23S rRNA (guanine(2069)-N(7))-methyltransferase RlmK/23S rRNA (guanine(2445)-N(2))-methyltransferase RlmL [Pseudomonadales bacterium]